MSTARPSPPTARSGAAPSVPRSTRRATRSLAVGLGLGLLAGLAPVVDLLTVGGLAAHLRSVYAGTGATPPAASAIATYLVGVALLGALGWLATLRAVRRGRPRAPVTAGVFLVLGAVLAVVDLTVTEYGRPILPTWLGVLGLVPVVPGLVATVLLGRRARTRVV
jgi:hypothetical protein